MNELVSFIIPNRGGKDLDKVIQNINEVYSDMNKEIVVVEQADNLPFKRGQLFNIGVRYANGKYLALSDNDIYHLRKVDWIGIYNQVKNPIIGFKYISQVTLQNGKPIITSTENCEVGYGGFNFMTKEDFIKANGFSNVMIGWGAEDNELFYRFPSYTRLPQNLGHLTHPKRANKEPQHTFINRKIWHGHLTNKQLDGYSETVYHEIAKAKTNGVLFVKVDKITVPSDFKLMNLLKMHYG